MKHYIITFCLLISATIFAQNFNQVDDNGKRHGKYKKTFDNSNITRYEGQFSHGKPIGTFKFYEAINNKAMLVATRVFNPNNNLAQVTFYSSKGNVISKGKMNNKLYVGEWLYYHKDSDKVMTQEFYNDLGKLDGTKKVYFLSGQVAESSNYSNGSLEGKSVAYAENGKILRIEHYKNNMFDGLFKNYDVKGNLLTEGNYSKDIKKGIWKFYQNGKLVEEKDLTKKSKNPYKNGKK